MISIILQFEKKIIKSVRQADRRVWRHEEAGAGHGGCDTVDGEVSTYDPKRLKVGLDYLFGFFWLGPNLGLKKNIGMDKEDTTLLIYFSFVLLKSTFNESLLIKRSLWLRDCKFCLMLDAGDASLKVDITRWNHGASIIFITGWISYLIGSRQRTVNNSLDEQIEPGDFVPCAGFWFIVKPCRHSNNRIVSVQIFSHSRYFKEHPVALAGVLLIGAAAIAARVYCMHTAGTVAGLR